MTHEAIIAVDPGTKIHGWAWGSFGRITRVGLASTANTGSLRIAAEQIVPRTLPAELCLVELMSTRGSKAKNAQDLIHVQAQGSALAGLVAREVRHVPVSTWKGSVDKKIHQARFLRALSDAERDAMYIGLRSVRVTQRHHVYDAVGILLHFWGRTTRAGAMR